MTIFRKTNAKWLLALVLAGCTPTKTQHQAAVPRCPAPPPLPVILETELQCLTDSAYHRLVERDLRRAEHITALEVNCE